MCEYPASIDLSQGHGAELDRLRARNAEHARFRSMVSFVESQYRMQETVSWREHDPREYRAPIGREGTGADGTGLLA